MSVAYLPRSLSKRIGLSAWFLGFASLVVPFAFVGENWGMVWMYAAAPLSFVAEETMGIRHDSFLLIGFVSASAAALWALLFYAIAWLLLSIKKKPNQSLQPNAGAAPFADEALPPRG